MHQHTKELKRASRDRLTIPRGFRNSYEVVELASQNWEGVFLKKVPSLLRLEPSNETLQFLLLLYRGGSGGAATSTSGPQTAA